MPKGGKRKGAGRPAACKVKVLTVELVCPECESDIDSFATEIDNLGDGGRLMITNVEDLELGSTQVCPHCETKYKIPKVHAHHWVVG